MIRHSIIIDKPKAQVSFPKWLSVLLLTFCCYVASAQEDNKKQLAGELSAQVLLSADTHALYINFVAGGIKYKFTNAAVALNVYPAFRYLWDEDQRIKGKSSITPDLAFGPLFQYKQLIVATPIYYVAAEGKWRFTAGIGMTIDKLFYKTKAKEQNRKIL